jgi:hypothetical protein
VTQTQDPAAASSADPSSAADASSAAAAEPVADCVLCGEPTEYPASTRGATYCPVCEWQEAQRMACSG